MNWLTVQIACNLTTQIQENNKDNTLLRKYWQNSEHKNINN